MKKISKIVLFGCVVFAVYLGTLYFIQNSLLFYPDPRYHAPTGEMATEFAENVLQAADGNSIMTWYHQGDKEKPAVLFLHGNAGQIATFAADLFPLTKAGYGVLMVEYRGFGNTKGNISQKTEVQDITRAYDWLQAQGYPKIIVYGYSFGTAFTCALTEARQPDGLILTAPFSALDKLVSEKPFPFAEYVLKDTYKSVDYLKKYTGPLLIIHGKKDTLIPVHHAQILYDNAVSPEKQIVLLDNESHTSIFFQEKNIPYIMEFLQSF